MYWYPFLRPPISPYLGNVAKQIRRRRISLKRDNHPTHPSVKSMAPPAPRECNQPARSVLHRKQSAHRPALRIPCIAAHCIATSSQHIGPRIASCAAQRTARMQPARAQRIASQTIRAPTTNPPRIARRARCASPAARRTPHTCSSARASQYFALVSFGSWY